MSAQQPAALRLDISVPSEVRSGARVPITLRARNTGQAPLDLYLRGRTIAFDIVISGEGGGEVWQRLRGQSIPAILRVERLAPGQTLELTDSWDQRTSAGERVAPGRYTVVGVLPTDAPEPLRTPPVPLSITPR